MNSGKQKPRVLITGAGGMLGHDLIKVLTPDYEVFAFSHQEFDIADPLKVKKIISEIHPQILINSAAFTKVDDCESQSEKAYLINGKSVGVLAQVCKLENVFFVHFSTDYVFDGLKKLPYVEEDLTHPLNVYGKSKLEGEKAVIAETKDFLIIRTSWLFGSYGPNFVDKMLELARGTQKNPEKSLRVVNDQKGCPTYTYDLAQAVLFLLNRKAHGFFHVTNQDICSWYDFACEILKKAGFKDISIHPIHTHEMKRPAARPHYSVLSNEKLEKEGFRMRSWSQALEDYLRSYSLVRKDQQ